MLSNKETQNTRKLALLGIRGVPAAHGGFESFAEKLVPWLVQRGWCVTVYCQGSKTGEQYEDYWAGAKRIHIPVKSNGALATVEFDIKSTIHAVQREGTLLTLGYNTAFLTLYSRMKGKINVINMDGIEWKRDKYSILKKLYLRINEQIAAKFGHHLIADHPEIKTHHSHHSDKRKISVIPYGGEKIENPDPKILERFELDKYKFCTIIARPEPENSVYEIVSAFSKRRRGFKLVILGNYSSEVAYQLRVKNVASKEVQFLGPIYDRSTVQALRHYSLAYIHGHKVGGTNPSLVEALAAGNAVIAHDNKFNRWVAQSAALYFRNEEQCAECFTRLAEDEELRKTLQENALERWAADFTWPKVLSLYEELLENVLISSSAR